MSWAFGDGTTAFGPSVVHAFSTAGSFSVSVIVANAKQTLAPLTIALSIKVGTPPNRIQNGTFDRDLSGWFFDIFLPGGQGPGDVSWSNVDASNLAASGSILLRSTSNQRAFQQVQCVPITPNERYSFGADARYGGAAPGLAAITVVEFASSNCTGSALPFSVRTVSFTAPLSWTHIDQFVVATSSSHSGYFFLAAQMTGSGTVYQAWFDNVHVRSTQ